MHLRFFALSKRPRVAIRLAIFLIPVLAFLSARAQTDETIFREFRFDFSTPGARANGMGRAFVGLADEATAAYNNPAGISVLQNPEFSIEFRFNTNEFGAIQSNDLFTIRGEMPEDARIDLDRLGFASYAFSSEELNFSFFFVNNLDYQRTKLEEEIEFVHNFEDYRANYVNALDAREIQLNTFGFSVSKDFGKLDVGFGIGFANLRMDYSFRSNSGSRDLFIQDLVQSQADQDSHKMTYVLGTLYQIHPKVKLGFVYKRQPRFTYDELVRNQEFTEEVAVPVTFKVPDSIQVGLAVQPNDFWTLLLDVDWVRYKQLLGDNMTLLSRVRAPLLGLSDLFSFSTDDYDIGDDPEIHLGAEYLIPLNSNIVALRAGGFYEPDHKSRFVGSPQDETLRPLYDIQSFLFNTDLDTEDLGYTLGAGFVWKDKLQVDIAWVDSDRFRRVITSLLYRF